MRVRHAPCHNGRPQRTEGRERRDPDTPGNPRPQRGTLRARLSGLSRIWLLVPLGAWLAWWAGSAVASEGPRRTFALSLAALAVGVPTVRAVLGRRVRPGFIAVEVPVLLLLLSTLVFRGRSADELAYNPLDPAAQFRVLCVALALMLGALALISRPYAAPRTAG